MAKGFFEQVAADKSQLGFDYQDLVCLEYLIDMKPGETVGLEVLDDVHHERIDGISSLVQVKHSVSDDSTLTNRDVDLWKTLYNWSCALNELGTSDVEFIFFTNKKKTAKEGIVQLIDSDTPNHNDISEEITNIKRDIDTKEDAKDKKATENPIKKYVDHIFSLSKEEKERLISKITIVFSADDIIARLTKKIEYFSITEAESLDVVYQPIGAFRHQKYKLIKSGCKLSIDYATFRNDFQFDRIIRISADRTVDFSRYHRFKNVNDIDPKDGLFATQLTDIDITSHEITEYAIEYAATCMFIQKLIVDGKFSESENESINEEVYYGWRTLHRRLYGQSNIDSEEMHKNIAKTCIYDLEDTPVQVANSPISRAMVTGKGIEYRSPDGIDITHAF